MSIGQIRTRTVRQLSKQSKLVRGRVALPTLISSRIVSKVYGYDSVLGSVKLNSGVSINFEVQSNAMIEFVSPSGPV